MKRIKIKIKIKIQEDRDKYYKIFLYVILKDSFACLLYSYF